MASKTKGEEFRVKKSTGEFIFYHLCAAYLIRCIWEAQEEETRSGQDWTPISGCAESLNIMRQE